MILVLASITAEFNSYVSFIMSYRDQASIGLFLRRVANSRETENDWFVCTT